MKENQDNPKSILEALLFSHGEPLSIKKISALLGKKEEEILSILGELRSDYRERGLTLMEKNGEWQMGTNPEYAEYVEKLVKSEFSEELSRAGLETIAVVVYKGPLTRAKIEFIRGVNSSFTLRNLMLRGLVERVENPKDARSYLYRVSFEFLKYLGITSVEELPRFSEFQKESIGEIGEEGQHNAGGE